MFAQFLHEQFLVEGRVAEDGGYLQGGFLFGGGVFWFEGHNHTLCSDEEIAHSQVVISPFVVQITQRLQKLVDLFLHVCLQLA